MCVWYVSGSTSGPIGQHGAARTAQTKPSAGLGGALRQGRRCPDGPGPAGGGRRGWPGQAPWWSRPAGGAGGRMPAGVGGRAIASMAFRSWLAQENADVRGVRRPLGTRPLRPRWDRGKGGPPGPGTRGGGRLVPAGPDGKGRSTRGSRAIGHLGPVIIRLAIGWHAGVRAGRRCTCRTGPDRARNQRVGCPTLVAAARHARPARPVPGGHPAGRRGDGWPER